MYNYCHCYRILSAVGKRALRSDAEVQANAKCADVQACRCASLKCVIRCRCVRSRCASRWIYLCMRYVSDFYFLTKMVELASVMIIRQTHFDIY